MFTSPLRAYRTGGISMPSRMLFRVRLLQPLRDLLHPAQLGESGAADHHAACEREPWLERSAEQAEPGRARRVHLRARALRVGDLGVQVPIPGLELQCAADVGEPEERATRL